MRCAVALAVVLATTPAHAQIAGTFDDPERTMMLRPEVTTGWLAPFAVRGLEPIAYVDGFEVPALDHGVLGRGIARTTLTLDPDLGYASPSVLSLDAPTHTVVRKVFTASSADVSAAQEAFGRVFLQGRIAVLPYTWPRSDAADGPAYLDAYLRFQTSYGRRWHPFVSLFTSDHRVESYDIVRRSYASRGTVGLAYTDDDWRARVAFSARVGEQRLLRSDAPRELDNGLATLDARLDVERRFAGIAGLAHLTWRSGALAAAGRHTLDGQWSSLARDGAPVSPWPSPETTFDVDVTHWRGDVAVWSGLDADLSQALHARAGARLDRFGAPHAADLALTPRASLDWSVTPRWRTQLAAGAYRRAIRDGDALLYDLNPERTTQVSTSVAYMQPLGGVVLTAYTQDLSRLVVRDAFGALRNTGTGTGYGVELMAATRRGAWNGGFTLGLGRSLRRDEERGVERPAALDQPLRAHVFATYQQKRWLASARASVTSGLPVTPVQRGIYDADLDGYRPIFASPNSDRLPTRVELAVRAERTFARGRWQAFADLLVGHGAIAYAYSRDYSERRAVTLPFVPFVGLRGML